ncbi:MAG: aromatic ring-hydroxylating dioxygenase subunit alpha [Halioglobus sp.]
MAAPIEKKRKGAHIANRMLEQNYPRNFWWVAARSEEVGRDPLARMLLDSYAVLFRKEDGEVVALEDRCPHRSAPLSMGRLEGDAIQCPYHGFEFDQTGNCVKVPSQDHIPKTLCVRSFPVRQIGPLIWIYLGDLNKMEEAPEPYDASWAEDESKWSTVGGQLSMDINYMLLRENVLDATHFPFLHEKTLHAPHLTTVPDMIVEGNTVTYRQVFENIPLGPAFAGATGLPPDKHIHQDQRGTFLNPAIHLSTADITDLAPEKGSRDTFRLHVLHITTPASYEKTHYFWFMGWDIPHIRETKGQGFMDEWRSNIMAAFNEDKVMCEAIQQRVSIDRQGLDYPEVVVAADRVAIRARQILEGYLDKEGLL